MIPCGIYIATTIYNFDEPPFLQSHVLISLWNNQADLPTLRQTSLNELECLTYMCSWKNVSSNW